MIARVCGGETEVANEISRSAATVNRNPWHTSCPFILQAAAMLGAGKTLLLIKTKEHLFGTNTYSAVIKGAIHGWLLHF